MTRNEIIKITGDLIDRIRPITVDDYAHLGELERFANDLCNAPTKHNRERRAITYTVRMATKKLSELRRKTEAMRHGNSV